MPSLPSSSSSLDQQQDVVTLDIPANPAVRQREIEKQKKAILFLAPKTKDPARPLDMDRDEIRSLVVRVDACLRWWDLELEMTPQLKQKTKIDQTLQVIFLDPRYHFPAAFRERAKALYEKWEGENWGEDNVHDDDDDDNEQQQGVDDNDDDDDSDSRPPKRARRNSSSTTTAADDADEARVVRIRRPPPTHPIWGREGIMHGLALKTGGKRRDYVFNPDYMHQRRGAKKYGHNGLKVGAWFPLQISALFHGAHGARMAGISGDAGTGAYSIVIAGHYDELDSDLGETVYYSGSGSHNNTDPGRAAEATGGTKVMRASFQTRNVVRVLRSSTGKSKWAPSSGLRYDGLYHVTAQLYPRNCKGGMYEQFKLERCEGQPPIDKMRPTVKERKDYEDIRRAF